MNDLFLKPSLCAVIDVLGFSEQVKTAYAEGKEHELLAKLERLLKSACERLVDIDRRMPFIKVKFFTDNIVIAYSYFGGHSSHALSHLSEILGEYQFNLACEGLFIRGGISFGTFACNERIVFGDSLIKAHGLESKGAVYPRILIDPNTDLNFSFPAREDYVKELLCDTGNCIFVNYLRGAFDPVPLKRMMTLNCDKLNQHRRQVEICLDKYCNNPRILQKYKWTAEYHNWFCRAADVEECSIVSLL